MNPSGTLLNSLRKSEKRQHVFKLSSRTSKCLKIMDNLIFLLFITLSRDIIRQRLPPSNRTMTLSKKRDLHSPKRRTKLQAVMSAWSPSLLP